AAADRRVAPFDRAGDPHRRGDRRHPRRGLRGGGGGGGEVRHHPVLPGALRHAADLRPGDAVDRAALPGGVAAGRRADRRGRLVDPAAARAGVARRPMTGWTLARRTAARYKTRTALAIVGVAVIGALNFDMILLSRGLLVSFSDLLDQMGFDVGGTSGNGVPVPRQPIPGADALTGMLRRLPE